MGNRIAYGLAALLIFGAGFVPSSYGGEAETNLSAAISSIPEGTEGAQARKANIEQILSKKVNVNAKNQDGDTPLIIAAVHGDVDVAKALMAKGADINAKGAKDGATPLMVAVYTGDLELAKALLDKKADLNSVNQDGDTALSIAVRNGEVEIVELLLSKGADINAKNPKDGTTPLMIAAFHGDADTARVLLSESKADINAKNYAGDSALKIAEVNNSDNVATLLKDKGATASLIPKGGRRGGGRRWRPSGVRIDKSFAQSRWSENDQPQIGTTNEDSPRIS